MKIIETMDRDNIEWILLHFMDIKGMIHQVSIRYNSTDNIFIDGVSKLDGSSIEGFSEISDSDLRLKPDPETYAIIPWENGVARFIADVINRDGDNFEKDGRYILKKIVKDLAEDNYKFYIGPEIEFFVFKNIRIIFKTPEAGMGHFIYSEESPWSIEGYPRRYKRGYYPAPPLDTLFEYRDRLSRVLEKNFRCEIDAHHHEVAATGQIEIDVKYDEPVKMADKILTVKYVARNLADKMGYYVTFMPKPLYGDNGSGMHIHISLWKNKKNLFYDPSDEYAELSDVGKYFIGGLIEHGRSLASIVAPTVNSYKRLVPGFEAPIYLVWSRSNRSSAIRIPMYKKRDNMKRIEFRPPDPSVNPYLAISAIILAGLDGVKKKIDPGDPVDKNVYEMSKEEIRERGIKVLPRDLYEALEDLERDHEYLKPYFSEDFIGEYIELKKKEYIDVNKYPTTPELYHYFSI